MQTEQTHQPTPRSQSTENHRAGHTEAGPTVETDLRVSESKYRSLIENTNDILFTSTREGVFTFISPAWTRILGHAPAEVECHAFAEFVHPDDLPPYYAFMQKMVETGMRQEGVEYRVRHKNGEWRWHTSNASPVKDAAGAVTGFDGIARDITARKQAEAELLLSRNKLRAMLDNLPFLAWLKDTEGRFEAVNEAFARSCGQTVEGIVGLTDLDVWPAENAAKYRADDLEVMRSGVRKEVEEAIADSQGRIWFETFKTPIFNEQGQVIGTVGIARDITDRKRAEEATREISVRLSLATKAGGVGVWDYDIVSNRIEWDEQMYALYGVNPQGFGGVYESWRSGVHPEDIARSDRDMELALNGEKEYDTEFRVVWPDGMVRHIRSIATVLRNADGKPLRMIGTNWDITDQKKDEEALRESEEKHRMLVQNLHAGVVVHAPDTHILLANDQASVLLGLTHDQLMSKTALDPAWRFIHEDGSAMPLDEYPVSQVISRQATVTNLIVGVCRPATHDVAWVMVNAFPEFAADGTLHQVVETFVDITERKRAEEALRASEANFRAFFASMQDMIVVGTPDGRVLYANDAIIQKLGYSLEELDRIGILGVHPQARRQEAEEIFAAMFRGERNSCPLPLQRKDGVLVPVETRVSFGKWDGVDCVFGISKDLSAEQEAQQRSERLFRNNPALMALSSLPDRHFVDVNDAFLKTLGYTRAEVIGHTSAELGLFAQPEQGAAAARQLRAEGRIANFEVQVRGKDGTLRDGLFWGEVISSQGREYFLTVMIDVTARKRAEEAIAQAQKHLAAKNKELEQLVYVASHDLRSPLVNVDGFSRELEYALKAIGDALAAGNPAALERTLQAEFPDMGAALARIRNSTRQMDTLLKGLLKLSRLGRAALHVAPVEMNDLLRQVCASFAFRVQEVGAELTVADVPPCLSDATQLTQVFANLIDNALKYRDEQRPCQVRIAGQIEGGRAVYRVADNGIGIAAAHQENIFELFHRLDPHATEGEGLGLTIVRQVLGRLDGEITVTSQPGVGSTFIVSLPAAPGRDNS